IVGDIGVIAGGNGRQLVQVKLTRQVGALASHVSHGEKNVLWELVLDAEIPLLHVRPLHMVWNGDGAKGAGKCSRPAGAANRIIPRGLTNDSVHRQGSGAKLQRLRVGFVAVHVLEEDAVTSANGPLAIAEGVIGKTEPRTRIDPLVRHAAGRRAGDTRDSR